ncbi:hypothetical protein N9K06_00065 [Omnitrophica bacterium]|nr:hypothetical protein [Candidatus Omnitrophota bacterium]
MLSLGDRKYYIVEIHLLIAANRWNSALRVLRNQLRALSKVKSLAPLVPLYYSWDVEDLEVRVCFLYDNVGAVDAFNVSVLRQISGVRATRVRLTLNGRIFPGGFQTLMNPKRRWLSAHIFIKNDPACDRSIWKKLGRLPKLERAYPTWIFRDFYEYDRDITLRVMGRGLNDIRSYLDRHVSRIQGVLSWRFKIMHEFVPIQNKKFLTKLAYLFLPDLDRPEKVSPHKG